MERDNIFRGSLTELLSVEGYEVLEVINASGLRFAKTYAPNLIICSRMFSDTNGWEVLQALKKEDTTKKIPFIFLSSRPAGEIHQKMMEAAPLIVLIKPFKISEFLVIIQNCLSNMTT